MFVECSSNLVKAQLAAFLVNFETGAEGGEAVALDIVELIAMRMCSREDYQVGVLGFFVRANLVALDRRVIAFPEALNRFTAAALAAPLGHEELTATFEAGLDDLYF